MTKIMSKTPQLHDINITDYAVLPAPELLCRELPRSESQAAFVFQSRREIREIIFGGDRRFLLIAGPCSIHDVEAGREYARRLAALARKVSRRILIVMRVYFEKPRTTVGWKGLIMDPFLDGTHDIHAGLAMARGFLRDVIDLGLPAATELLDPITPQYLADLICWSAIGARTSESQTHRQMASGLSMPVGFKNSTCGNLVPAVNGIRAAGRPQTFFGVSHQGLACAVTTNGNPNCHLVLRGGENGPNYGAEHLAEARSLLEKNGLRHAIVADCSHDNCGKDPERQPVVLRAVVRSLLAGQDAVIGAMLESGLAGGRQPLAEKRDDLVFGQSITDPCLGWERTEASVKEIYKTLAPRFKAERQKSVPSPSSCRGLGAVRKKT